MGYHARKNIVTDGLVFYIDAYNNIGGNTPTTDPNIKNIVNPNMLVSSTNGLKVEGGGYKFDSIDSYIDADSLIPSVINDNVGTIECWVKEDARNGNSNDIFSFSDFASDSFMHLAILTTGKPFFLGEEGPSIGGSGTVNITVDDALTLGKAHHIVLVQDGTEAQFYINGVAAAQTLGGANYPNHNTWLNDYTTFNLNTVRIGALKIAGNSDFQIMEGTIYTASYYNRNLSAEEVKQNYEALKHRFH